MLKFATSVSWRVLRSFVAAGYLSEFPSAARTQADLALDAWTRFLLGERPHPGRHEQHMILADVIDGSSISDLPPNINRYLARAIEPYVAYNENSVISYAKMGRFVLFGFVDVDLSRYRSGLSTHLGGLSFECQGTFSSWRRMPPAWIVEPIDVLDSFHNSDFSVILLWKFTGVLRDESFAGFTVPSRVVLSAIRHPTG